MLAGLHRVLLGREPEGVHAHRVQDIPPVHAHEPREDVGADVPERVPDVQARAAGVREHVEHEQLLAVDGGVEAVAQRAARIRRPERVVGLPAVLPLRLDRVRETRVVAELGNVGRSRWLSHRRREYLRW